MTPRLVLLSAIATAIGLAQAPAVSSVENAASNIPPGLPNSGIARGSMFVVKGSNLGPANIVIANSFPLQTNLAGTTVQVTVGGATSNGILYYSSSQQVAAILPSTAVAGIGTLIVNYNGRASVAFPVSVVTSNPAMYTLDSTGSGDAIVTLADNTLVTASNAPVPGEIVVFWANGLGPVTFDETRPALPDELTTVALEVFVGGVPARVVYRGRNACCSSVDQINVELPLGVTGCVVPVMFKIGNAVSGTATIPIAVRGRACTPTRPGLSQADYQQLASRQSVTLGGVTLARISSTRINQVPGIPPVPLTTRSDEGTASFSRYVAAAPRVMSTFGDIPALGSCNVTGFSGRSAPTGAILVFQNLDAGASLTINGPAGNRTLSRRSASGAISYSATLGNATQGNYLDPGPYTVTGPGGPQGGAGAFSAQVMAPPALNWTNQSTTTTVDRFMGVTVNWTGGDPNGFVQISGSNVIPSGNDAVGAAFVCTIRASERTFTVPSMVLLALPPSTLVAGIPVAGDLAVSSTTTAPFTASGVDFAALTVVHSISQTVVYQ